MVEVSKEKRNTIQHLFQNMHDTVILSCLQGYMGRAWADNLTNPTVAVIHVGSFCFIAGERKLLAISELLNTVIQLAKERMVLIIPENKLLGDMIEDIFTDNCTKIQRFGIKKKQEEFDLEHLRRIVDTLPEGYILTSLNSEWYDEAVKESWSEDFVSNFQTKEEYLSKGLGKIIIHNRKIVSGASSYTVYDDGIEIEIGTREEYRNNGLALIVGAALILNCRERGLYPSWDAANLISVRLAMKLGYEYEGPYDTYLIQK